MSSTVMITKLQTACPVLATIATRVVGSRAYTSNETIRICQEFRGNQACNNLTRQQLMYTQSYCNTTVKNVTRSSTADAWRIVKAIFISHDTVKCPTPAYPSLPSDALRWSWLALSNDNGQTLSAALRFFYTPTNATASRVFNLANASNLRVVNTFSIRTYARAGVPSVQSGDVFLVHGHALRSVFSAVTNRTTLVQGDDPVFEGSVVSVGMGWYNVSYVVPMPGLYALAFTPATL